MEISLELLVGRMKDMISDLTHDKTMLECCIEQQDAEIKQLRSSLITMTKEAESGANIPVNSEIANPQPDRRGMMTEEPVEPMVEPEPITDLGQGDPPPEMVEQFGMETIPADGDGDEVDGEAIDLDSAIEESERIAQEVQS